MCALAALIVSIARAHDPMGSWTVVQPVADGLRVQVTFSSSDARVFLRSAEPEAGAASATKMSDLLPRLQRHAAELLAIEAGGTVLVPRETAAVISPDENVEFTLVYPWPERGPLRCTARFLERFPPEHMTYLSVIDSQQRLVAGDMPTLDALTVVAPLPPRVTSAATGGAGTKAAVDPPLTAHQPTFGEFLVLGVEHILTGYDHLLFLAGLLVACRRLGSMVKIVTFFTLAHSITLALAALDFVNVSSRLVEPLIAATIVFVALENLLRDDEPRHRWALTFAFGLVHGFGFASVLREMGVGRDGASIALPLFSFNLGVEAGQLMVVALVLPLLLALRRRPAFVRFAVPAFSVVVGLLGAYWFYERVFVS